MKSKESRNQKNSEAKKNHHFPIVNSNSEVRNRD